MYAIMVMVLFRSTFGKIVQFHIMIWGMCQPLLITFVACNLIFSMKRRSERKVQRRPKLEQNRRLIQSLLTVIVCFWLMWLPFTICTIRWVYPCKVRRCRRCPLLSLNFLKVLHYMQQLLCQSNHIRHWTSRFSINY